MFINIALTFKSPDRWWILYASVRAWVQHLSSAKGHYLSLFQWWLTHFGLFMQISGRKESHHWNGDQQWQPLPITIPVVALNSSSGGELKLYLGWKKKHDRCLKLNYKIFLCCGKISPSFGWFYTNFPCFSSPEKWTYKFSYAVTTLFHSRFGLITFYKGFPQFGKFTL